MDRLCRRLPPLNCLVAFEAVVRCGTITAAAAELGTTQPAVSQRLRVLEAALGTRLFRKAGRTLQPTGVARRYSEDVAAALGVIAEATAIMTPDKTHATPVIISAPFGFAHLWLAPLLPALEGAFPAQEFVVRAEDDPKFVPQHKPDIEVQFGPSSGLSYGAHFLLQEIVQPVCSPLFAARHGLTRSGVTPQILLGLPLLHLDEEDPRWCNWPRWFAANGVRSFRPTPRLYYNNYPLLEQAAIDGKGIALAWHGLVDPLIAAGKLVGTGNIFLRQDWGYVLHVRNHSNDVVRAVADWISSQAQVTSDQLLATLDLPR